MLKEFIVVIVSEAALMSTRQSSVDRASVRREEYLVLRVVLRVSDL